MILSVSRRTDIPRWYSEWLLRRLRAGEVLVRNPYRPGQLRRVPPGAHLRRQLSQPGLHGRPNPLVPLPDSHTQAPPPPALL